MLEIDKVNKSYGKKQVLYDVSYTFRTGIYGFLGPNGAGKSTLMQIMTDNLKMDSGRIFYQGKDIQKEKKEYKKVLGYVPQIQDIYENFTAFQFLEYIGALKSIDKKIILSEIKRVLEIVGLTQQAGQKLGTYSGGMKQRILVAQALLGRPQVLILDEPTAGLDPKERIRLRNYISRLGEHATVILATHVVSDVESIAKEILLLGEGKIRKHGSVEQLCSDLDGYVYEFHIPGRSLQVLEEVALVSNIQETDGGRILVRCIAESHEKLETTGISFRKVSPNLQEVYLYTFAMQS